MGDHGLTAWLAWLQDLRAAIEEAGESPSSADVDRIRFLLANEPRYPT